MTTIALIVIGVVAFCGGLVALVIASVKRQERDRLLREQAELNERLEHERVQKDEEIHNASDDELTRRLNSWVQPSGSK